MSHLGLSNRNRYSGGFTLIELLVVISIISLISSTVFTAISDARNKARLAANKRFEQSIRSSISDCSVAFYNFEGSSNSTVREAGGTGPDGTINGNPSRVDSISGLGKAMEFDGSDDFIETSMKPSSIEVLGSSDLTIADWVQPYTFNGGGVWEIGKQTTGNEVSMRTLGSEGNWRSQLWSSYDVDFQAGSANKWLHIALVQNSGTTKVYTDGSIEKTKNQSINLQDDDGFYIGRWASRHFNGKIDNVRIYNCAFDGTTP
jgi:prepilin-type N-terminal cleavage/methylation domain-containing protein